MKKNKQPKSNEKLISIAILFWFIIVMPYLCKLEGDERKFHEENGIISVKGVCIENSRLSHGRFIKYKLESIEDIDLNITIPK